MDFVIAGFCRFENVRGLEFQPLIIAFEPKCQRAAALVLGQDTVRWGAAKIKVRRGPLLSRGWENPRGSGQYFAARRFFEDGAGADKDCGTKPAVFILSLKRKIAS
jgi:hypothetical protein